MTEKFGLTCKIDHSSLFEIPADPRYKQNINKCCKNHSYLHCVRLAITATPHNLQTSATPHNFRTDTHCMHTAP